MAEVQMAVSKQTPTISYSAATSIRNIGLECIAVQDSFYDLNESLIGFSYISH